MNNESGNNYLGIATVIVVIVLIGYSLFNTGYLKNDDGKISTNTNTENLNNETEETKNVGALEEIVNNDVKLDLNAKIAIANLTHGDSVRKNGTGSFYEQELYKNISDGRLLLGLIEYLRINKDDSIKELTSREAMPYVSQYPNIIAFASANDLKEKSLYYLGKDCTTIPEGPNDSDDYGTAWIAFVLNDNKYYISSLGGDPTPSDMAFYYPYKYERNAAQAYVYVSVTKGAMNDHDGEIVWNIYKGVKTPEVYKSFSESQMNQYLNFQVNEDNYQNFTKYKYIFDMKNGNYYFRTIERIE
jgi:hypothetical protein